MKASSYTTMDFREELARVRRARRRNTAIIVVADAVIIVLVAMAFLLAFSS